MQNVYTEITKSITVLSKFTIINLKIACNFLKGKEMSLELQITKITRITNLTSLKQLFLELPIYYTVAYMFFFK